MTRRALFDKKTLFKYKGLGYFFFFIFFTSSSRMILTLTSARYFLYHMRVIRVWRCFFWSWKMPYINASAVGGQPGT